MTYIDKRRISVYDLEENLLGWYENSGRTFNWLLKKYKQQHGTTKCN